MVIFILFLRFFFCSLLFLSFQLDAGVPNTMLTILDYYCLAICLVGLLLALLFLIHHLAHLLFATLEYCQQSYEQNAIARM